MRKTEACGVHLGRDEVGDERGHVLANGTVDILGGGVRDELQRQARNLCDGVGELGVGNGHYEVLGQSRGHGYGAYAHDAFVSSLSSCSRLDSIELTLPSVNAAASLSAVTAFSNFWNFLSLSESTRVETSLSSSPLSKIFLSFDLSRA
jgi:hypothetical protein